MKGGVLEGVSAGKAIVDCATLAVEDMERVSGQVAECHAPGESSAILCAKCFPCWFIHFELARLAAGPTVDTVDTPTIDDFE